MKVALNETVVTKGQILERDSAKLPQGVLCRVSYPNVCNIGKKNANNRVYDAKVWELVHGDQSIMRKINERTLFGHAEHPESTQSNVEKVSHVVIESKVAEDHLAQVYDVLDTPYGRIVDTLLAAGCGLGVSTRAEGELEEMVEEGTGDKYYRVKPESYHYITTDFTADPSTYGTAPEKIERDLVATIAKGVEAKKLDAEFATVLLECMKVGEAKVLLEKIKAENKPPVKEGWKEEIDADLEKVKNSKDFKDVEDPVEFIQKLEKKYPNDVEAINKYIADKAAESKAEPVAPPIKEAKKDDKVEPRQARTRDYPLTEAEAATSDKLAASVDKFAKPAADLAAKTPYPNSPAIMDFLVYHWKKFLDKTDAVYNLVQKFKLQEPEAEKYLKAAEEEMGPIRPVYVGDSIKIDSFSGLVNYFIKEFPKLEGAAKQSLMTVLKEVLLPSEVRKVIIDNDIKLAEAKAEVEAASEIVGQKDARINEVVTHYSADSLAYTKKLQEKEAAEAALKESVKSLEATLKEANEKLGLLEKDINDTKAKSADEVKLLKEDFEKKLKAAEEAKKLEIKTAVDKARISVLKEYGIFQIKSLGIKSIPRNAQALLEKCGTFGEVDVLIEKFRDAVKEGILHSGVLKELREEKEVDPDTGKIYNKVGTVMGAMTGKK